MNQAIAHSIDLMNTGDFNRAFVMKFSGSDTHFEPEFLISSSSEKMSFLHTMPTKNTLSIFTKNITQLIPDDVKQSVNAVNDLDIIFGRLLDKLNVKLTDYSKNISCDSVL